MNLSKRAAIAIDAGREDLSDGPVLLLDASSQAWYCKLGPVAWMALQHLALNAQRTDHGWAAPVGVRGIAAGIGVTKDTANRAITALAAAELVTRDQVDTPLGRRRSGYRVHLPHSMRLVDRPQKLDEYRNSNARCPDGEYEPAALDGTPCNPHRDSRSNRDFDRQPGSAAGLTTPRSWDQPVLFETAGESAFARSKRPSR